MFVDSEEWQEINWEQFMKVVTESWWIWDFLANQFELQFINHLAPGVVYLAQVMDLEFYDALSYEYGYIFGDGQRVVELGMQ
jgi:hypothetical protein